MLAGCAKPTEQADPDRSDDEPSASDTRDTLPLSSAQAKLIADRKEHFRSAEGAAVALSELMIDSLTRTMSQQGIVASLEFCQAQAPKLAEQVGKEYGVRIGRVAVQGRQRNPDNVAQSWQAKVLARFQQKVDQGAKPDELFDIQTERLPDDVAMRVMYGIGVSGYCLACHGSDEQRPEEIREPMQRLYPGDQATGFKVGDLRGALWVEVPAR